MMRCFACNRPLGKHPAWADTRDAQIVQVGNSCIRLVNAAGEKGYQPPNGGPRLYPMQIVADGQTYIFRSIAHDDAVEQEYRSWQKEVEYLIRVNNDEIMARERR